MAASFAPANRARSDFDNAATRPLAFDWWLMDWCRGMSLTATRRNAAVFAANSGLSHLPSHGADDGARLTSCVSAGARSRPAWTIMQQSFLSTPKSLGQRAILVMSQPASGTKLLRPGRRGSRNRTEGRAIPVGPQARGHRRQGRGVGAWVGGRHSVFELCSKRFSRGVPLSSRLFGTENAGPGRDCSPWAGRLARSWEAAVFFWRERRFISLAIRSRSCVSLGENTKAARVSDERKSPPWYKLAGHKRGTLPRCGTRAFREKSHLSPSGRRCGPTPGTCSSFVDLLQRKCAVQCGGPQFLGLLPAACYAASGQRSHTRECATMSTNRAVSATRPQGWAGPQ